MTTLALVSLVKRLSASRTTLSDRRDRIFRA
jgi:hypothetical protein